MAAPIGCRAGDVSIDAAVGTRIAGALGCLRKAVLEERFGGGTTNAAAVSGTLLHELLQVYA